VYGCVFAVACVYELASGLIAPARFLFWTSETPPLPGPLPIWYGRVIGKATDLRPVDQERG
jgi:hypothetical protein